QVLGVAGAPAVAKGEHLPPCRQGLGNGLGGLQDRREAPFGEPAVCRYRVVKNGLDEACVVRCHATVAPWLCLSCAVLDHRRDGGRAIVRGTPIKVAPIADLCSM